MQFENERIVHPKIKGNLMEIIQIIQNNTNNTNNRWNMAYVVGMLHMF